MMSSGALELSLPVSPEVDASPAKRPKRTTIKGQFVTIAPLDPASQAQALWEGTRRTTRYGLIFSLVRLRLVLILTHI
jgi:hypothetical protein